MNRSYLITTEIAEWCKTLKISTFTTGTSLIQTTLWEVLLSTFIGPERLSHLHKVTQ